MIYETVKDWEQCRDAMLPAIAETRGTHTEDDIIADKSGAWRVKAVTEIAKFNATFGTQFDDDDHDTIGGLVLKQFGRMPKRGDQLTVDNLNFKVLRADSRRLHLLLVEKKPGAN